MGGSHAAGAGMGRRAKLVVEAGSSADKKDMETEQGVRLVRALPEEVSVSAVRGSRQLCPVDSRDHFPMSLFTFL